jgi:hypothetical protein
MVNHSRAAPKMGNAHLVEEILSASNVAPISSRTTEVHSCQFFLVFIDFSLYIITIYFQVNLLI